MKKIPANLTAAHHFEFEFRSVLESVEVSIEIPSLDGNDVKALGDWGPCFQIFFHGGQYIKVGYRAEGESQYREHLLFPEYLAIESPMLASVRKQTPWFYIINDDTHGLRHEIFIDQIGRMIKTKSKIVSQFERPRRPRPALRLV